MLEYHDGRATLAVNLYRRSIRHAIVASRRGPGRTTMIRMLGVLVVGTILAAPAAMAAVDLPSEGTFKVTFFMTDDSTKAAEVPAAGDKSAWSFVETATYTNDAGHGFLHEATGRCVGMGSGNKAGTHNSGYCVYVDPDGDQIFSTFDVGHSGEDQPLRGTKEYTGGTGKYVGLTGHAEYSGSDLKTLDKDAPEVFEGHAQGSYKLRPVVAGSNTPQLVPGHPHQ
jgi:hypothetical protein